MKKNYKIVLSLTFLLAIVATLSYGQAPPPGPPPAPPGVPIDGGITLLLAGLGVYGYKKIKSN